MCCFWNYIIIAIEGLEGSCCFYIVFQIVLTSICQDVGLESLSDASKAVCSGWVAIASMYGTSTYVWLTFMGVNLSKYTTHASYGYLYI